MRICDRVGDMKLICAPMAELCHPALRCLIEEFGGCDEYYTEMINAASLVSGGRFEKYYADPAPVPEKIVWQLSGKSAGAIAAAAEMLAALGGIGVDLNMGCSAPAIYASGAGIAWMLRPQEETRAMVRETAAALAAYNSRNSENRRLSVKLRLGDDDFTDDGFFSFCDMLVAEGVRRLALHPRTRREKYRAAPRRQYAEKLALRYRADGVSVVVNGDIRDRESAAAAAAECPHCAGLMIGRAAVRKPWIFSELRGIFPRAAPAGNGAAECDAALFSAGAVAAAPVIDSAAAVAGCAGAAADVAGVAGCADTAKSLRIDLLETALSFVGGVQKYQPPEFWTSRLRRFFGYYCDNLSFAHYARTQFQGAQNPEDLRARIRVYFEKVPDDRFLTV